MPLYTWLVGLGSRYFMLLPLVIMCSAVCKGLGSKGKVAVTELYLKYWHLERQNKKLYIPLEHLATKKISCLSSCQNTNNLQNILFYNSIPCLNCYIICQQSIMQVFTQSGTNMLLIRVAANWPSLLPVCSQSAPSLLHYHTEVNIVRRTLRNDTPRRWQISSL